MQSQPGLKASGANTESFSRNFSFSALSGIAGIRKQGHLVATSALVLNEGGYVGDAVVEPTPNLIELLGKPIHIRAARGVSF